MTLPFVPVLPIIASSAPALPPSTNLLRWWKLNTDLTQSGGFASAWLDQIAGESLSQATGAAQPSVDADGSLIFNGSTQWMATASFGMAQPLSVYFRAKQVSWAALGFLCDGTAESSSLSLQGIAPSPDVVAYAGSGSGYPITSDITVGSKKSFVGIFDGASGAIRVSGQTAVTGDVGTRAPGGLTLGSNATQVFFGNWQVYEIAIYGVADNTTEQDAVFAYLDTVSP